MVKLSTRSEYACIALIDLAEHYGKGLVRTGDIARRRRIPRNYLDQILLMLQRAHYVSSRRGAKGGHCLAKDPAQITLAEIVRMMDGALAPSRSVSKFFYEPRPIEQARPLMRILKDIRDYIATKLEATTFADLVGR